MKEFTVTGVCVPEKHYMADISGKIAQIKKLIDKGCYFTINRARQYGKTTTLLCLENSLKDEYIAASISFEGLGDESFSSAEAFCPTFVELIAGALRFTSASEEYIEQWENADDFRRESNKEHKTEWVDFDGKRIFDVII